MPHCQLHQLGFSLPQGLTSADLPQVVEDLFGIPGLDPAAVKQPSGRHGYGECYSLRTDTGAEIISILCHPRSCRSPNTTHFSVHGLALEAGNIDVRHLCQEIMARHGWGSDAHLAADDTDNVLPWSEIVECSAADTWADRITTTTCRPRKNPKTGILEDCPPTYLRSTGETVYYGASDSDLSVCAYTRRGPIRVETRIRNRAAATDIIRRIAAGEDMGSITAGILRRNLKFHEAGTRRKDRRPVCAWWDKFLGAVEPIKLPRHRDDQHRSPWFVPPTRADKAKKYITGLIRGDDTDGPVVDVLREIITDREALEEMRTFAVDSPPDGNGPYDYVSRISTHKPNVPIPSALVRSGGDVSRISTFDLLDFCPEISF